MPDTVKVPLIGNVSKGTAVTGGFAAVGIVGFVVYRSLKKKKTTASTATTPQGTQQYGYGGSYAYGYGSEYGYGGNYGYSGLGGGGGGGGIGGIGSGEYGYGYYGAGGSGYQTATTNAQWSEAAVSALSGSGQYSTTTILAALGVYLTGGSLTSDQEAIVQAAIASEGYPPVPGPNGYPPAMNQGGGGGGTGQGGGGPTGSGNTITAIPGNFRVTNVSGLKISLAWDPVQVAAGQGPLAGYTVAYGQSPSNLQYQQSTGPNTTTATVTFNSGPGAHGLRHYFEVWARPASPGGPHAGPISAVTQ